MTVTQEDAKPVKSAVYLYLRRKYAAAMPTAGLSTLRQTQVKFGYKLIGKEDSIDDYCIVVGWQGPAPNYVPLPKSGAELNPPLAPIRIFYYQSSIPIAD